MNNIPTTRNGEITINEAGLPVKLLKKIPAATKAIPNKIPPMSSHFQAMIRTRIMMNAGMLCMNRQISVSFPPISKQSIENIIIKRIARMARMRGDQ